MRFYLFISTLLLSSLLCISQNKKKESCKTQMVDVPDSIRYKLACAEVQKSKLNKNDSSSMALYIFNLENMCNKKFINGIYSYRVMGSHFERKLFIYNNQVLYIFTKHYLDDVIKEYSEIINNSNLTSIQKINYLKVIHTYLLTEYKEQE